MSNYVPFNMCPLTQVKVGGSLTVGGTGGGSYVWSHSPCMGSFCKLYAFKFDEQGELYAEGCNLEFQGMTEEEIKQNIQAKVAIMNEINKAAEPPDPTRILGIT